MNERIAKLYDQALMLEGNGDYVAGELDPEKFAELIVRECLLSLEPDFYSAEIDYEFEQRFYKRCRDKIIKHFGIKE